MVTLNPQVQISLIAVAKEVSTVTGGVTLDARSNEFIKVFDKVYKALAKTISESES